MTSFWIVNEQEFPHGLKCADCQADLPPGMVFTSRPECILPDGGLVEDLVCVTCRYLPLGS